MFVCFFIVACFVCFGFPYFVRPTAVANSSSIPATSTNAVVSPHGDALENAEDETFIILMEKYLKDKGTSSNFIEKLKSMYIRKQKDEVRALLSKLMTSDKQLQEKFDDEFEKFVQYAPDWDFKINDPNRVIFWNNPVYQSIKGLKILRTQKFNSLCYIMAPVVLMHYVIAINSNGVNTDTLDVSKYENFANEGAKLENFIEQTLAKTGDISYVALKELMKLDDLDIKQVTDFQENGDMLMKRFAQYPAIICAFTVYNLFLDEPQVFTYHHKLPGETIRGYHSMLIVGARKDASGNFYYLLQNWWKGKYFLEVSAEYLESVKPAAAYFVMKKISDYPQEYHGLTNDFLSGETLDMPDHLPVENN